MTTAWCARLWTGERVLRSAVVEMAGAHITAVTADAPPPPGALVLEGLVLPGFDNAHSHAFHRVLRGRSHAGAGSFWAWRDLMYAIAERLDPDSYRRLATAVFAEMLEAGYTRVAEFHYLHHGPGGRPYAEPRAMSRALADAAEEAGIRLVLLDTLYLTAAPGVDPDPVQRRFADADVDSWLASAADLASSTAGRPFVEHGLAVHSVRAVPPPAIAAAAMQARERGVPLHAHVSEQPRENDECLAAYGRTPVEVFADAGALGPGFTAVHATHLTAGDIALLAGSRVCLCPTTERDLADGIGPAALLRDTGAVLRIGSDSNAVVDPLEEIRAVEMDERLASLRRGAFAAAELVSLGTDSALVAPGRPADLVEVALGSTRLAGFAEDAVVAAVVHAGTAADVRTVVVAGQVRVRDGRHARIDTAAALSAAIAEVAP